MKWPFDPELAAFGAKFTACAVTPGEPHWQLVVADGPMDIGGNHHIYVDVWDEAGNRLVGVPVIFHSAEETWPVPTEAKPGETQAANLAMSAGGNAYGVYIGGDLPSDKIFGLGMPWFKPHHSFRLVFQRTIAERETGTTPAPPPKPTPPPPPPSQTITAREAIDEAVRYLQIARAALRGSE
jgi:hypothetical protein